MIEPPMLESILEEMDASGWQPGNYWAHVGWPMIELMERLESPDYALTEADTAVLAATFGTSKELWSNLDRMQRARQALGH